MRVPQGSLTGIDSIPLVPGVILIPCVGISSYPSIIVLNKPHRPRERKLHKGNETTADKVTKQGPLGLGGDFTSEDTTNRHKGDSRTMNPVSEVDKFVSQCKRRNARTYYAVAFISKVKPRHP